MPITRREDWPKRMDDAINAARNKPFGYALGENHCCLFMGDVVLAMTDTDVMAWFRGKYKCERGAYVAVKRHAGGGLRETVEKIAQEMAIEEISPLFAQQGDVVMHWSDNPDDPGVGICVGSRFVATTKPMGLIFRPMSEAKRVWRI